MATAPATVERENSVTCSQDGGVAVGIPVSERELGTASYEM